jgi:hypothetical protein
LDGNVRVDEQTSSAASPGEGATAVGRSPRAVAIALIVALVGLAAAASANTLTYVNGGRVWVSAPDGSDAHLVTPTGSDWRSPTLADDGTVYAFDAAGDKKVHLFPPGAPEAPPISISVKSGFLSMDVAPDRGGLAWMYIDTSPLDHRLLENSSVRRLGDGYTRTLLTDWWPTWKDARHVVISGVNGSGTYDSVSDAVTPWFSSLPFSWDGGEEVVSTRAGDKTAIRLESTILSPTSGVLALTDTSAGPPDTAPGCHTSRFAFKKLTASCERVDSG